MGHVPLIGDRSSRLFLGDNKPREGRQLSLVVIVEMVNYSWSSRVIRDEENKSIFTGTPPPLAGNLLFEPLCFHTFYGKSQVENTVK